MISLYMILIWYISRSFEDESEEEDEEEDESEEEEEEEESESFDDEEEPEEHYKTPNVPPRPAAHNQPATNGFHHRNTEVNKCNYISWPPT